jgi:hypothetical protein
MLSRAGQLQLTSLGHGDYSLMLPKAERNAQASTVSRRKKHQSKKLLTERGDNGGIASSRQLLL